MKSYFLQKLQQNQSFLSKISIFYGTAVFFNTSQGRAKPIKKILFKIKYLKYPVEKNPWNRHSSTLNLFFTTTKITGDLRETTFLTISEVKIKPRGGTNNFPPLQSQIKN